MAIVMRFLNVPFTNEEMGRLADETGRSTFAEMRTFAASKRLFAEAVRLGPEQLMELRQMAILQVLGLPDANGARREHFLVFAGPVDERRVWVYDPITIHGGRGAFPIDELAELMTGNAIVISKRPIVAPRRVSQAAAPLRGFWPWGALCALGGGMAALGLGVWILRGVRRHVRSTTVILCIAASCTGYGCSKRGPDRTTRSPASSAAPRESPGHKETPQANRYLGSPSVFHAGRSHIGETVSHEYVMVNPDPAPVKFAVGKKSCGCITVAMPDGDVIPPAALARVVVAVRCDRGGKNTHEVLMNVSRESEPIRLALAVDTERDTLIAPQDLAFGDVVQNGSPGVVSADLVHSGKQDGFRLAGVTCKPAFLTCQYTGPTTRRTEDDGIETRYRLAVRIDANAAPLGGVDGVALLHGSADGKDLEFELRCHAMIVQPVAAHPDHLVRMQSGLPEQNAFVVSLNERNGDSLRMVGVEGEGLEVSEWTAKAEGESSGLEVSLHLRRDPGKQRTSGVCRIMLETVRTGRRTTLELPVLLVETGGGHAQP